MFTSQRAVKFRLHVGIPSHNVTTLLLPQKMSRLGARARAHRKANEGGGFSKLPCADHPYRISPTLNYACGVGSRTDRQRDGAIFKSSRAPRALFPELTGSPDKRIKRSSFSSYLPHRYFISSPRKCNTVGWIESQESHVLRTYFFYIYAIFKTSPSVSLRRLYPRNDSIRVERWTSPSSLILAVDVE